MVNVFICSLHHSKIHREALTQLCLFERKKHVYLLGWFLKRCCCHLSWCESRWWLRGKKNIQLQPGRVRMWRSFGRFCQSTTGGADSLSAHIGLARISHMVIATAREAGKYSLALCSEGGWDRFQQHIVVSAKVISSSFHYMKLSTSDMQTPY